MILLVREMRLEWKLQISWGAHFVQQSAMVKSVQGTAEKTSDDWRLAFVAD